MRKRVKCATLSLMTNTETTNQFCLDPAVLLTVEEVNGHAVLDRGTDGNRTYVLCHMPNDNYTPFVTWSIWRNETGKICAEHGTYCRTLTEAVESLNYRTGRDKR